MDAAQFEERTGRKPENEDLERVNCVFAGQIRHLSCGWCETCDVPRFECSCPKVVATQ